MPRALTVGRSTEEGRGRGEPQINWEEDVGEGDFKGWEGVFKMDGGRGENWGRGQNFVPKDQGRFSRVSGARLLITLSGQGWEEGHSWMRNST